METTYQFEKHQRGRTCGNATTLLSNHPDRTASHDIIKTFALLCSHTYTRIHTRSTQTKIQHRDTRSNKLTHKPNHTYTQNTTHSYTQPHKHQPSHLTDREGALGALAGALWEPPSTEAGWDPPSGATVTMGAHHGLHGVAPHAHGPLQEGKAGQR